MSNYWEERIREEMKIKQKDDTQVGEDLKRLYRHHLNEIEKEIDHFIMKYGADGQVSPAQARKLVDEMDVVSFSEKAKRYVEEKNFSPEASAELKLYNLKMKVSRAEMLKQHLDLELLALTEGETQFAEKWLNRQFYKEMELQAGILGESLPSPKTIGHMAKVIVNTPYQNAVWSERIWKRQDILRREVSKTVGLTLMRGRNSTTMIPEIRKMFEVNSYQAKRLLVTETARMQTEVQKEMYTANDIEEYIFMAEPSACKICSALDGKTFQVSDMTPGKNASPMHPHCHCATAPDVRKEREELERLLEEVEKERSKEEKETDLSRLYRNKNPHKRRAINRAKQNQLTKEFRDRGGYIWQNEEAVQYLNSRGAAAATLNADTIALRPQATISEVLEELYHAEQWRIGTVTDEIVSKIKAEIDAQHYLLSISKRYNIPENEILETRRNLRYWKEELKRYEN